MRRWCTYLAWHNCGNGFDYDIIWCPRRDSNPERDFRLQSRKRESRSEWKWVRLWCYLVPRERLELSHLAEQASETCVSTISPPGLASLLAERGKENRNTLKYFFHKSSVFTFTVFCYLASQSEVWCPRMGSNHRPLA